MQGSDLHREKEKSDPFDRGFSRPLRGFRASPTLKRSPIFRDPFGMEESRPGAALFIFSRRHRRGGYGPLSVLNLP